MVVGPNVVVTDWNRVPVHSPGNESAQVNYSVDVRNENFFFQRTATIWCEVHTEGGTVYKASKVVTLGANEVMTQVIVVDVPFAELAPGFVSNVYTKWNALY